MDKTLLEYGMAGAVTLYALKTLAEITMKALAAKKAGATAKEAVSFVCGAEPLVVGLRAMATRQETMQAQQEAIATAMNNVSNTQERLFRLGEIMIEKQDKASDKLEIVHNHSHDLHAWHAPDTRGMQTWKHNKAKLDHDQMEELRRMSRKLTALVGRHNEP